MARDTAQDSACGDRSIDGVKGYISFSACVDARTICKERNGIEESLNQTNLLVAGDVRIPVYNVQRWIQPVDGIRQHRMPKAINRMSKFCDDCRIEVGRVGEDKRVDVGLDFTCKFFEYEMLILHFGDKSPSLEQALAVPDQACSFGCRRNVRHLMVRI